MRKLIVITALLSCFTIVGCGESKESREKRQRKEEFDANRELEEKQQKLEQELKKRDADFERMQRTWQDNAEEQQLKQKYEAELQQELADSERRILDNLATQLTSEVRQFVDGMLVNHQRHLDTMDKLDTDIAAAFAQYGADANEDVKKTIRNAHIAKRALAVDDWQMDVREKMRLLRRNLVSQLDNSRIDFPPGYRERLLHEIDSELGRLTTELDKERDAEF